MPVTFQELPVAIPSVSPVATSQTIQAGYCGPSDVASLNKARAQAWGLENMPTVGDVNGYIMMVAGQIDAVLLSKGYAVPVNTGSYPEVEGLLAYVNAQGAAYMVEEASPNSPNIDRVKAAYDAAMDMLTAAQFALDVPIEEARAQVRAPFVTFDPPTRTFDPQEHDTEWGFNGDGISGIPGPRKGAPFFARGMRF